MIDLDKLAYDDRSTTIRARCVAAAMAFCKSAATPSLKGVLITQERGYPEARATDSYMGATVLDVTATPDYSTDRPPVFVPLDVLRQMVKASPKADAWLVVRDEGGGMRSCATLDPVEGIGTTATWRDKGYTFPKNFLDLFRLDGVASTSGTSTVNSRLLATACKAAQVATGDKDVRLDVTMRGTNPTTVTIDGYRDTVDLDALIMPCMR